MPQKTRDVKQVLQAKGFQEEKRDHWYYIYVYDNKLTHIKTKISYGDADISDANCSKMARQINLSNPQFRNLLDCCLTKEKYLAHLIEAGHIASPKPPDKLPKKNK